MKRNFVFCFAIFFIVQSMSCVTIYRYERDKRDRCYIEGVEFYKQKKFEEAKDRFDTVVDIEPEYKDAKQYLNKTNRILAIKEKKIKQKANSNYEKGIALMKNGKYSDSLEYLLIAQEQDPDIIDIDEKIDECRQKLEPEYQKLVKLTEKQYKSKQFIPAYKTYLKSKIYNPSDETLSSIKRDIEKKLEAAASKYIDKAEELFEKKQYESAKKQTELAFKANPWDEDAKELSIKINNKLNLEKDYQKGITFYNNANYFGARSVFTNIAASEPGYKGTEAYLNKINAALSKQVGGFYKNGVTFYDNGNYEAAISEFNKVLAVNPNHTNAQEYRERAQTKLEIQKSVESESK